MPRLYYPKICVIFHRYATVVVGNALSIAHDAAQDVAHYAYQTVSADGDTFTIPFHLSAGAYTLNVLGVRISSGGKVDWYIDGTLAVSGQDWYGAGTTRNIIKTAVVTVYGSGQHVLRGVVNGLTAPSTGYDIRLSAIAFT
jgi:hypothetical protein